MKAVARLLSSPFVGVLSLHLSVKCSVHLCDCGVKKLCREKEKVGKVGGKGYTYARERSTFLFLKGRIVLWGRYQCLVIRLAGFYSWLCHRLIL